MHRSTLIGSAVTRRLPVVSFLPRPPAIPSIEPARAPGLHLICAVELCERLAGVMVSSLLVLYLNEGLGLDTGSSAKVASYVNVLSYLAGVLGGMLADRGLGARRAVLVGLVLLALGYAVLGLVHGAPGGLWAALSLVVGGHGLFKPNMAALVGALYAPSDPRRARAFSCYYYAVNIGALIGPCVGGLVRTLLGWGAAFGVAAVCVAATAVLLRVGKQQLRANVAAIRFSPQVITEPPAAEKRERPIPARSVALVLALAMLALFGAALSHSYGTLLLWARDDARRTLLGHAIPPDFFAALPAAFVLLLGPVLDRATKALAAHGHAPSEPGKFTVGMLLCALAYSLMLAASLVHPSPSGANPGWLVACKVALALGELLGVPVGLALVERLAPLHRKGLTLGLCYLAHAVGYWLGGEFSALWPRWSHARFFGVLAVGCIISAALIQSQTQRFAKALTQKP